MEFYLIIICFISILLNIIQEKQFRCYRERMWKVREELYEIKNRTAQQD